MHIMPEWENWPSEPALLKAVRSGEHPDSRANGVSALQSTSASNSRRSRDLLKSLDDDTLAEIVHTICDAQEFLQGRIELVATALNHLEAVAETVGGVNG